MYCPIDYVPVLLKTATVHRQGFSSEAVADLNHGRRFALHSAVTNTRRLFFGALAALALVIPATSADAQSRRQHSQKIDSALEDALRSGATTQNVIITLKPGYRAQIRELLREHGDLVESEHESIDALVVKLHSNDVNELAERDEVAALALDSDVYADGAKPTGPLKKLVGNSRRDRNDRNDGPSGGSAAPSVTSTLRETLGLPRKATASTPTGSSGVGVVIIDSGVTPSENFNGRITGFYDFVNANGRSAVPYDDYGHGTHVAALVASSGALSNDDFQGIAPAARLVVVKVLDQTGQGRTSDVIRALDFVVANKRKLNAQIINLSLGHPIFAPAKDDPLVQAVQKATAAGYIVITSAGNRGVSEATGLPSYGGVSSPCNAPSAICVGATNTQNSVRRNDDVVAPYSGRGPSWFDGFAKPDVVAPGHKIAADANPSSYLYKTLPKNRATSRNGQPLLVLSGTSMGAGVATGVAALVVDAHNLNGFNRQKPLTANLVKALLEYSSIAVGDADYLTQGAGQINATPMARCRWPTPSTPRWRSVRGGSRTACRPRPKSAASANCGHRTSSGAIACSAATSCSPTTSCGATTSSGARTSSGVTALS
jgi:subtilisin family serine protease